MTSLVAAGGSNFNSVEIVNVPSAKPIFSRKPPSSPQKAPSKAQNERFLGPTGRSSPWTGPAYRNSPARRRRDRSRRYSANRSRLERPGSDIRNENSWAWRDENCDQRLPSARASVALVPESLADASLASFPL